MLRTIHKMCYSTLLLFNQNSELGYGNKYE